MRCSCNLSQIRALALMIGLLGIISLTAENAVSPYLAGVTMLPEADKMLQLHNRDVVAYFDMREISTPLKVKNFQNTDEHKTKLAELEEIRKPLYSGTVYAMVQLSFQQYNFKTGRIKAEIPCPGDLLGRKLYNSTIAYFDDPKVFNGVTFSSLPTCDLSQSVRNFGSAWYALDLKVSEAEAADLEEAWTEVYLIGKISGSKQMKIFYHDYWDGLQYSGYPAPTIAKDAPVVSTFKLVIYDREADKLLLIRDFKPATK